MKQIYGDLVKNAFDYDVILHGCNCFCSMGAGIAASIRNVFPEAYEADKKTIKGSYNKLGSISVANTVNDEDKKLYIVNLYSQYNGGADLDYDALRLGLRKVARYFTGKKIGLPKIGAGIAGGDWEIIQDIIIDELGNEDVTIVLFEEPNFNTFQPTGNEELF